MNGRKLRRLLLGLAGVFVILVLVGWLALRASLPTIDGEASVAGIDGAVTIARDGSGIPVISASSRTDLAFGTGYAHGQDRFFQMDLIRRKAAGELSALVGGAAVDADKRFRFHRFRARAQLALDAASPNDKAVIEAYAMGVNAGLDSLRAKPFEYFVLRTSPEEWQAVDSVLAVFAMYMDLNDSRATRDVRRGLAQNVLPPEMFAWLYPVGTEWDAPIMGSPRELAPIPPASVYSIRDVPDSAARAAESGRGLLPGSNNWAVSGAFTSNGRALVANDMHLGHSVPNIWYRARLRVEGGPSERDLTGVTLPGAPFVISGSNSQVAWGFTNSYGDWTDAVLLRPGDVEASYKTPDGDKEFATYLEVIEVKGGDSIEIEIRETIWGPVLEELDYPGGEVAVSWIAHQPEGINLRILDLEMVTSVSAALDVANTMSMPPQNFVTGDADGNIGWTIAGQIPRKANFDPLLPADWSLEHGWQGWLAPAEYPRVVNPESGRIWTANARVVDGEALRLIGDGGYALGARAQQIRDSLFAQDSFTPDDMLAIQYDDRALFLARWRELLLDVLDADAVAGNPELAEYRRLADEWIPRAIPDSVGYRLVRAFRLEVERKVFHALMAPVREAYGEDVRLRVSNQFEGPLWAIVTQQPMHLLPQDYASWQELLVTAVQENIAYYAENYAGPLVERTWGESNTASIRHPLSGSIPLLGDYLNMPADQLNGGSDLPKAQGSTFGASERFAVYPGAEDESIMHMPVGQSGHPLSDFYARGHEDWVLGLPSPFLPDPAQHILTLVPASR